MNDAAIELVPTPTGPVNLFGTTDPHTALVEMKARADVLASVVKDRKLYTKIHNSYHVHVEAWTFLGSMLGVFPACVWTKEIEGGWEARVEARTLAGNLVGAAEACCTRDEPTWKSRPSHSLRSMAQTRATAKALRMPLGFIMVLAGYNPTPYEEMPPEDLTEPLKASIAMVQAKKAAKTGRMQGDNVGVNFHFENNVSPPGSQPPEMSDPYKAPPLCPACKSPVGRFVSESQAHKGRAYWQCQRANDRVLELEERLDLTQKQIHADIGVAGHWRSWAEPWPRKA